MIYLDYQATTPLAPEVREAMLRWLGGPESDCFGNPSSAHRMGRTARAAVEHAREQVAALFPSGGRVIFTSGATEALNLALRGTGGEGAIAASAIEHSAALDTARDLGELHTLGVDREGICHADQPLPGGTRLVAVMQVNNEIGTVQPVGDWAERAGQAGALMVVDAVQAYGKLPLLHGDLIANSAHKFHGPKGIGALWVRDGIELRGVQTGGGQESGLRSGTLAPALIAGMGVAAELAHSRMEEDRTHIEALWARARDLFVRWTINGDAEERWHGNLNIRRDGLDVARLMSDCREIMFSAGSACASGSGRPSHVLQALGLSASQAKSSVRLGFGRYTTMTDIEQAARQLNAAAEAQGI